MRRLACRGLGLGEGLQRCTLKWWGYRLQSTPAGGGSDQGGEGDPLEQTFSNVVRSLSRAGESDPIGVRPSGLIDPSRKPLVREADRPAEEVLRLVSSAEQSAEIARAQDDRKSKEAWQRGQKSSLPKIEDESSTADPDTPFAGTPERLIDMMRSRLEELRAEKLKGVSGAEDAADEYVLPKRLKFLNDDPRYNFGKATTTAELDDSEDLYLSPNGEVTDGADNLNDFNATLELNRVEQAMKEDDERYYRLVSAQLSGGARSLSNMVSGFDTDVAGSGSDRDHLSQQSKLNNGVYLLRAVQRAGLCSRRAALLVVSGGKVKVDGKVELNPFRPVFATNDIHVEGHQQRLRFAPTRLWLLNKPANVYTSGNTDKKERKMYMEYAAALGHEHLIPVGSLPYRSNGALLLTNDGELSRFLEHPSSRVQSTYTYRVTPAIDPVLAHKWNTEGVMIDGVVHREFEFVVFTQRHSKYAVKVKVRSSSIPVHQVLQHVGRRIIRGGRTSIGPYGLQGMFPGHIREVVVPPYFVRHISDVWRPFIERDWPYFRKIRLEKLKAAVNYRILTKREREELDAFTYDQLMDTLKQDHSALVEESRQYSRALRSRPSIEAEGGEVALPDGMSPESEVDVRSF